MYIHGHSGLLRHVNLRLISHILRVLGVLGVLMCANRSRVHSLVGVARQFRGNPTSLIKFSLDRSSNAGVLFSLLTGDLRVIFLSQATLTYLTGAEGRLIPVRLLDITKALRRRRRDNL